MILAGKYEIPDTCPLECPFNRGNFGQGDICTRCPIFNCRKFPDSSEYADEDGFFYLMKPEQYRPDWAKVWYKWFKGDMKEYPILYLERKGENV